MSKGQKQILLDTNLLVYLYIKDFPRKKIVKRLIDQWCKKGIDLFLTEQSLLEFYSVITDHRRVKKPVTFGVAQKEIAKYYQNSIFKIICPTASTFAIFLRIITHRKIKGAKIFDFYLAATALSNGVETIYTENDRNFKKIKGLRVVNPFI